MLDAVLLPEGTKLTSNLCRVSTAECMDRAVIDETFAGTEFTQEGAATAMASQHRLPNTQHLT